MLWPKASPLDMDFGLCARAKLFNFTFCLRDVFNIKMVLISRLETCDLNLIKALLFVHNTQITHNNTSSHNIDKVIHLPYLTFYLT